MAKRITKYRVERKSRLVDDLWFTIYECSQLSDAEAKYTSLHMNRAIDVYRIVI